jgi:putative acetyltransferase
MNIKLRKAGIGDEKIILQLVEDVLSGFGLKTNPEATDRDISDLNKYYFDNNGWFSVLEDDGEIIGSYGIYKIDKIKCELRKMYLLHEYQGKGLGKLMMETAFNKARELGYIEMILETNKLLTKARGLYQKYGFKEVKSQHFSDRCDLAMIRKL